jgi:3-oxoacyl-[acyl-carrier protein] reductase
MELGIKNKSVLVSAGSRGLGKATAKAFALEGCRVAICGRNEESLSETAKEISEISQSNILSIVCDLTDGESIIKMFKKVESTLGELEIMVINSGGPPIIALDDLTDEHWEDAYRLTHLSAVRMIRSALPNMRKKNWGRIIAIESSSVKQPVAGLHLSNGIRAGVSGFFKSIVDDLAKNNITINTVLPGVYLTDRILNNQRLVAEKTGTTLDERLNILKNNIPMGRFGKPQELADMITFISSERAAYVTGAVIQVDGGLIRGIV